MTYAVGQRVYAILSAVNRGRKGNLLLLDQFVDLIFDG